MENIERRNFLKYSLTALAAAASSHTLLAKAEKDKKKLCPLPPGAISLSHFKSKCTACQLCVEQCHTGVLQPSLFENGLTGMMQPIMKFEVGKFCEYDCRHCTNICPTGALIPLSLETKKLTQVGQVKLAFNLCVVNTDHEDCGACAEHCPTAAIKMIPWKHGLTRPIIANPEVCIGCGGCESICPTNKLAIWVERNEIQAKAQPPIIEKQEDVTIDGFGF